MKKISALLVLVICAVFAFAQAGGNTDSSYANGYYVERVKYFAQLKAPEKAIIFLGNSITEAGEWQEVLPGKKVINRGISGDNSFGVYARLDALLTLKPAKVFLLIGINDLKRGTPLEVILNNYRKIIGKIKKDAPKTTLYLQSVLPVAESVIPAIYAKITNEKVKELNKGIKELADSNHLTYIDLYNDVFVSNQGQLKIEFTTDGLHLKAAAYIIWAKYLQDKKYL
ncbi:MAG: family lipase [Ferruginibacter sp.]|nr:family lipase [Ferruginibacter sp.]